MLYDCRSQILASAWHISTTPHHTVVSILVPSCVQTAQLNVTKAALTAVAEVESRHSTWSLGYFGADPFTGPAETVFPYPNQILATEDYWILPGRDLSLLPLIPSSSSSCKHDCSYCKKTCRNKHIDVDILLLQVLVRLTTRHSQSVRYSIM